MARICTGIAVAVALALNGACTSQSPSHPKPPASVTRTTAGVSTPFECRLAEGSIAIDGKADEQAWANAQVIDGFQIPWAARGPARQPGSATTARLLWDDEHLYFYAEMTDRDLYADITEHQGELWYNDVFELFLKPDAQKLAYYEFEVNASNATLELAIPARGAGGYPRFKRTTRVKLETAVTLDGTLNRWQDRDGGWFVEGRLAWRDLAASGGAPKAGDTWTFNLCRYDYSVEYESPELSCVAPLTMPDYHRYEEFVPLRFVGATQQP